MAHKVLLVPLLPAFLGRFCGFFVICVCVGGGGGGGGGGGIKPITAPDTGKA